MLSLKRLANKLLSIQEETPALEVIMPNHNQLTVWSYRNKKKIHGELSL